MRADGALAVCGQPTRAVRWTLDATGASALVSEVAGGAALLVDASEVPAIVACRTTLPVLAMIHAVSIAGGAAAASGRTRAALAVGMVATHAGVRALNPAISPASAVEVTRRTTSVVDARIVPPAISVSRAPRRARCSGKREWPECHHYHRERDDVPSGPHHRTGSIGGLRDPHLSRRCAVLCSHRQVKRACTQGGCRASGVLKLFTPAWHLQSPASQIPETG